MKESKDISIDKFLSSKMTTLIFIGSTVIAIYLAFTGLPNNNNVALQLQSQRIETQAETIATLTKTQQNDTQEVKSRLADIENRMDELCISLEKLSTIIDERIPKD